MALSMRSPHLPPFLAEPIDNVASSAGLPADQLRMVLALLAAIPLGQIHKHLPNASIKHAYSFVIGLFFCYFLVGISCLHQLFSAAIVYILCKTLDRKTMPIVVFIFSLAYLSGSHIYRLYTDYLGWSLDYTMIQMIWCVKAVTLAYNWSDGQALLKSERLHEKEHIHNSRASAAILQFPSLLEYSSYVFFYGGVLVGPAFEIKPYLKYTDLSLFKEAGLTNIPSTILPSLKRLLWAILAYVGVVLGGYFPIGSYLISEEFDSKSFFYKYWFVMIGATCLRCKYYFAWYFSEAASVSCGLGFSGTIKDKNDNNKIIGFKWDRCSNVNAIAVETGYTLPIITNNWNTGVNNWLKNYVYFRVDPPRSVTKLIPAKSLANIITKATSAFWHGFYAPYYFFFLTAWLINEMDDAWRAAFQHYFFYTEDGKTGSQLKARSPLHDLAYKIIGWFLIFTPMNQLGLSFNLLRLDWSFTLWKSCYYIVFIAPITVLLISLACKPKTKRVKPAATQPTKTQGAPEAVNGNGTAKKSN